MGGRGGLTTALWIDYLTEMEALRVSIGLEAYAQRDPLGQYKNKPYALFQGLLSNVRRGVTNRMFTFRPRLTPNIPVPMGKTEGAAQADISPKAEVSAKAEISTRSHSEKPELPEAQLTPEEAGEPDSAVTEPSTVNRSQKRRRHRR